MTDDKGASDGPYKTEEFKEGLANNSEVGWTHSGIGFHTYACGFNAGRKAERERCLEIAMNHLSHCDGAMSRDCLSSIVEKIKGGQDAK